MPEQTQKPVVFVKHACPFSFKVRVFLLDAGLLDTVELREASTAAEEQAMQAELASHVDKVSYPIVRFGNEYIRESDDIIAVFAQIHEVQPDNLPTFRAYIDGPFAQLLRDDDRPGHAQVRHRLTADHDMAAADDAADRARVSS